MVVGLVEAMVTGGKLRQPFDDEPRSPGSIRAPQHLNLDEWRETVEDKYDTEEDFRALQTRSHAVRMIC